MAGILTQAQVFSEFTSIIPAQIAQYLYAMIVGPQVDLHQYSNPTEKVNIAVGPYNASTPTTYTWPGKEATSLVDLTSVGVYIDDALLNYYTHATGGGTTITATPGFTNRIVTSATDGFAANGASYPRLAALYDRDVQIGDIVYLSYSGNNFYSSVNALITDVVAATIGSATSAASNPSTQSATSSVSQTGGTVNDVTAAEDASAYEGEPSGYINETYTVVVTQGSTGGDATTALVNIISGSSTDNQTGVSPAAFASPFAIGTRGATFTFNHTSDDLVVGQTFLVSIAQAFTKPSPTAGGTYTGTVTQTYIVTVTRGGKYSDASKPQVTVTSSIGADASGPTTVTAAATYVPAGTEGVLIEFSGTSLRLGDVYYITVTGPDQGGYHTIQLNNVIPTAFYAAADIYMQLSIEKNIQVPQERISAPPALNWTTTQSSITLNAGVVATDPSLTNLGVQFYVPVISGPTPPIGTTVYISYNEFATDWCGMIGTLSDPTMVASVLGSPVPQNPLAYGVWKALLNSNGQPVSFMGICDPSNYDLWTSAFNAMQGLQVANIVPLSFDPNVNAILQTFIDAQEQLNIGNWPHGWLTAQAQQSIPILDQALSSNTSVVLATLLANPMAAGTQYTYFQVTSGNANFVSLGVLPGDVVRYLFSIDAFGNTTWTDFVVAQVVNEDSLIVALPGNSVAVGTSQKIEIWRNQSNDQIAQQLAQQATAYNDTQMRLCWPDQVDTPEGLGVAGYFLTAAFAGFVSGIAPHQGVETIPLTGFIGAPRSTLFLNNGDLITLAKGGVFVSTADSSGNVYAQYARTTNQSSADTKYESVIRNDDAIRNVVFGNIAQFFGISNLTSSILVIIQSEISAALFVLQSQTFVSRLDLMVTDYTIIDIRQSTTSADTVIVQVNVTRPMVVGQLDLTLVFTDDTSAELAVATTSTATTG